MSSREMRLFHPTPTLTPSELTSHPGMVWIEGGTFLMGSNSHYPDEAPAHRVTVDGFWIDQYPVTNERFAAFVNATEFTTFAEIAPNPADYPGALPSLLHPGSLVFRKPARTGNIQEDRRRRWLVLAITRSCTLRTAMQRRLPSGRTRRSQPRPNGSSRPAAVGRERSTRGGTR